MANKNIEMLKAFIKIMGNDNDYINLIIPNSYVKDIYSIDYKELYQKGYRNIIFDIDNTILPVNDIKVPSKLINLLTKVKKIGFNICIVSNNKLSRVLSPAKELDVSYLAQANKPNQEAFDKALAIMGGEKEETIMVGDQMLSDINGANKYGLFTILVDPLTDNYDIKTKTSRVLQNMIEKKLAKKNIFHKKNYYK